ncbi:MAG TPA: ChbG/HpnK family deacetylase [Terriglobales bacterium]|nr:ChbG/HpnK family deacetylase [Terriglobales bacterium]
MRRLIVNADDFGLTSGVNQAIAEAHQRGIVTSTTLMANGRAFADAARLARTNPNLSVGCHVVLVDGQPVSRPEQVHSLLAPAEKPPSVFRRGAVRRVAATMAPRNSFYDGFGDIAKRSMRGQLRADQIEQEVISQVQRLQGAGIDVTHIDTHKHTHMLPRVADAVFRGARASGVRAIRNPFVPNTGLVLSHIIRRPILWKRFVGFSFLRGYNYDFRHRAEAAGLATPNGSFGVISTGALNEDIFRAVVDSIPEGTWEFVCHPGYNDDELSHVRTRLRDSRVKEFNLLTSPWAKQILDEHKVKLVSYRDLVANQ